MIRGFFLPSEPNVPVVQIIVSWEQTLVNPYFILDTGFTGDLKVSPITAEGLGLKSLGTEEITIANGQKVRSQVAIAYALMEGTKEPVSIIIEEGSQLVGIGLFTKFGYKIEIDCKNKTIELVKVI